MILPQKPGGKTAHNGSVSVEHTLSARIIRAELTARGV